MLCSHTPSLRKRATECSTVERAGESRGSILHAHPALRTEKRPLHTWRISTCRGRPPGFSLDPSHLNYLEPGKRPFHTIIPGFLTRNGEAIGPFGVMGGHMQPQGHVQMVVNMVDYGLNPQASLDAPRWFWGDELWVQVEPTVDPAIVEALSQRGHEMNVDDEVDFVGRGQIIWRLPSGVYIAGSEPRADGCAIGY